MLDDTVMYCRQCGFAVETKEVVSYETEAELAGSQSILDESELDYRSEIYVLRKCPRCGGPFLIRTQYFHHHEAGSFPQESSILYPGHDFGSLPVSLLPERIADIYSQAKSCAASNLFDPAIIMCRKCLEAVCIELGAQGSDLSKKINFLYENGVIEKKLSSWATQLRIIGNDAAHDIDAKFSESDVEDSMTFLEALLMYLYTLDKKFSAFQIRRTKK
jgi:hypothetical protein